MSAPRRGLKDHAESGVGDLTRRQIMAAVDKIAKTGKRGAAKDLRKHTHTFLEWCVSEGHVDQNVLAGYREPKETRAQRVARRTKGRALTDDEISKVWHASGKLGAFGLLTRMCLLGGPRRSEPTMIECRSTSWRTASPSMRHGPRWVRPDSRALHRPDRVGGHQRNAISAGDLGRAATAPALRACAG